MVLWATSASLDLVLRSGRELVEKHEGRMTGWDGGTEQSGKVHCILVRLSICTFERNGGK